MLSFPELISIWGMVRWPISVKSSRNSAGCQNVSYSGMFKFFSMRFFSMTFPLFKYSMLIYPRRLVKGEVWLRVFPMLGKEFRYWLDNISLGALIVNEDNFGALEMPLCTGCTTLPKSPTTPVHLSKAWQARLVDCVNSPV